MCVFAPVHLPVGAHVCVPQCVFCACVSTWCGHMGTHGGIGNQPQRLIVGGALYLGRHTEDSGRYSGAAGAITVFKQENCSYRNENSWSCGTRCARPGSGGPASGPFCTRRLTSSGLGSAISVPGLGHPTGWPGSRRAGPQPLAALQPWLPEASPGVVGV